MKTIKNIPTTKFLNLIQSVLPAVGTTTEVLKHVNIHFKGDEVTAFATNLEQEMSFTCLMEGMQSSDGDVYLAIPGKKINDILKLLSASSDNRELLAIKFSAKEAVITSGRGRYKINILPDIIFPAMNINAKYLVESTCSTADLYRAISRSSHAMSSGDVRPALNGMLWEFEDNKISFIATDGHRMACSSVAASHTLTDTVKGIIPSVFIRSLGKYAKMADEVSIALAHNFVSVRIGDIVIDSRLIDGQFPDWRRVIPRNQSTKILVDSVELQSALKRVAMFSDSDFKSVNMTIENNAVLLSTTSKSGSDKAEDEIECNYTGDSIELAANPGYIVDALSALGDGKHSIRFDEPNKPLSFVDSSESPFLSVVMPVRL